MDAPLTADSKVVVNKDKNMLTEGTDALTSAMDKRSAVAEESSGEIINQQQQRKRRANNKKRRQQQTTSNINDDNVTNDNNAHRIMTTSPVQVSSATVTDVDKGGISSQSEEMNPSKTNFKSEGGTTISNAHSPQQENKSTNPQQRPPTKKVKKDKSVPIKDTGGTSISNENLEEHNQKQKSTTTASATNNTTDSNNNVPLAERKKRKPKPQRKKKTPISSNQESTDLVKEADVTQKMESASISVSPQVGVISDKKDNNNAMELLNQEGNPNITSDITKDDGQNKTAMADVGGTNHNTATNSKGSKKGKRGLTTTDDDLEGTSKSSKKSNIARKETTKFNVPEQKIAIDQHNRRTARKDRQLRKPDNTNKRTSSSRRTKETVLGMAEPSPEVDVCFKNSIVIDQRCSITEVETSLNHLKLAGEIIDQPIDEINTTAQKTSSVSAADLKSEAVVPIATTVFYVPQSIVDSVKNEAAVTSIGQKLSSKESLPSVIDTKKQCGTPSEGARCPDEPSFPRDVVPLAASDELLDHEQPSFGTESSADGEHSRTNLDYATNNHTGKVAPIETIQNDETSVLSKNSITLEDHVNGSSQKQIVSTPYNDLKLEINAESAAHRSVDIALDNSSCSKTDVVKLLKKDFVSQDPVIPTAGVDAVLQRTENLQDKDASETKHTERSKPSPVEDVEISMNQLKFSDSNIINCSDGMHVVTSQRIFTEEDVDNVDHVKVSSSPVALQVATPQDSLVSVPTRELAADDLFTGPIGHVQKNNSNMDSLNQVKSVIRDDVVHEHNGISIVTDIDEIVDVGMTSQSEEINNGDPFTGATARNDDTITHGPDITNFKSKVVITGIEEKMHLCNLDESFEHYTIDLSRSESNTISLLDNSSYCHPEDRLDSKDTVSVADCTQHDNVICDASAAEVSTVLISNVNPNFVDSRSPDNSRRKVIPRQTRGAIGSTANAFLPYNDDCPVDLDQPSGRKSRCNECNGCIIT